MDSNTKKEKIYEGPQECSMVMVQAFEQGQESMIPAAVAITIAPSEETAIEYAEQELKHYVSEQNFAFLTENLGPIIFSPITTTVFLYTHGVGRIK